jgi:gliding-associated putative ABC transporter substrate-binding component GldG
MKKNLMSIGLVAGILILINLLSKQFFVRWDVTQDKQYTLSRATKNILRDLEEPVLVKAFFTSDLPQQYQKPLQDFQNLLVEYSNRSKSMVDFQFIDPGENEENTQLAMQSGISPLLINVRDKDAQVQKKAFMGAVIESGALSDVIPFIQPEGPMEYQLTTAIKKVSRADKPSVAMIQGHGEPSMQDMSQAVQTLSVLYNVEALNLQTTPEIDPRFKTVIMIKPKDTIPPDQLIKIDDFLNKGGNLLLATDRVDGNFQTVQGTEFSVGLENWLAQKGIQILPQFIVDHSSGSVSVQQQQGFFKFNTAIPFPFFPLVKNFVDHPITKGIEQVVFQFASPINFMGDSSATFTPIVTTSANTGTQNPPLSFNIDKQWTSADYPLKHLTLGGVLRRSNGSSFVVFSDGDFALGAHSRNQNPDNISLMVNAVDFLSDDTGLIDLRTKGVTSRPIDELEETKISMIKWTNFLLPIALVLLYGLFRFQQNRNIRVRRMEERYT